MVNSRKLKASLSTLGCFFGGDVGNASRLLIVGQFDQRRAHAMTRQRRDLRMPEALEALDAILHGIDGGTLTAPEAIEQLLAAHIQLRNNRRFQAAMRSSRLPMVKQLGDFDFTFQPSVTLRADRKSARTRCRRASRECDFPRSTRSCDILLPLAILLKTLGAGRRWREFAEGVHAA